MNERRYIGDYDAEVTRRFDEHAFQSFTWSWVERPGFKKHLSGFMTPRNTLLDVGCGSGRVIDFSINPHEDSKGGGLRPEDITGIDRSPYMIERARERVGSEVNLIQINIENLSTTFLPLPEAFLPTYIATSNLVFAHLDNNQLYFALFNIYNALMPRGTLFYIVGHPDRVAKLDHIEKPGWVDKPVPWGGTMPFFHRTTQDYIELTKEAGFFDVQMYELEVLPEARQYDATKYHHYTKDGIPPRLAVIAKKPSSCASMDAWMDRLHRYDYRRRHRRDAV